MTHYHHCPSCSKTWECPQKDECQVIEKYYLCSKCMNKANKNPMLVFGEEKQI